MLTSFPKQQQQVWFVDIVVSIACPQYELIRTFEALGGYPAEQKHSREEPSRGNMARQLSDACPKAEKGKGKGATMPMALAN